MPNLLKNKLSIYLLKEGSQDSAIFKDIESIENETINDVGEIFYDNSNIYPPGWLNKFFSDKFNNLLPDNEGGQKMKLFNASTKAVLILDVSDRKFAVTFGYGNTLLKPGSYDERFGLKVAVNILDYENIKKISKTSMSATPKVSQEQISKEGTISEFGLDIEQDLVSGITGKVKLSCSDFGKTVTGKSALSLSVPCNALNIKRFLEECLLKYQSLEYKDHFDWIDQVSEIGDPTIISRLDNELVEKIKNSDFQKTWMSIPDIVKWEDVDCFKTSGSSSNLGDDIDLPSFISSLTPDEKVDISLDLLKGKMIDCVSSLSNTLIDSWRAYNCLYSEIDNNGKTYILSNGKWYEIARDFSTKVKEDFNLLRDAGSAFRLPQCNLGEKENDYNIRVAAEMNLCCMDCKTIVYGGGKSKIEFCDLMNNDGKIIHVKHYGASSVLSHLFAQGLVSGELFVSAADFRVLLNRKLPASHKLRNSKLQPKASNYEIVFAVISKHAGDLDIPFFSKVNLRNAVRRLKGFGYKTSLIKVSTAGV